MRIMIGIEAAVDRLAGDLAQLRRVPAVAAQQRHRDAQLAGLQRDVADVGVVARNEDDVRLRCRGSP